jgi:septal ring factor EnvC (AmiA/AmiB activator)
MNDYYPGKGCECSAHSRQECGCDVDWTDPKVYRLERELAASQAEVARLREELATSKAEIEHIKKLLKDPAAVHMNMLRGNIVKLSWDSYEHIIGTHPCREEVARLREAYLASVERDDFLTQENAMLREEIQKIRDAAQAVVRIAKKTANAIRYLRDEIQKLKEQIGHPDRQ